MDVNELKSRVTILFDSKKMRPLKESIMNKSCNWYWVDDIPVIYGFWLIHTSIDLENLHREVSIKGPKRDGDQRKIFHCEWDWVYDSTRILLYVGKTTKFKTRLGLHLKLGTQSTKWERYKLKLYKPTTSCQLRSGIEHIIQKNHPVDGLKFVKNHLHVSYIEETNFAKRFYIEDLAIGLGRPWFNLDSER